MTPFAALCCLIALYIAWRLGRGVGRLEGIEEAERVFALNHETFVDTQRKQAPWQ